MANSYVRYTGNGATTNFSLTFPYIDQSHVTVTKDGVSASFTWVNLTTVQLSPAPANGVVVEIRRTTPSSAAIVDFQDGAVVTEQQLDTNATQALYLAQESSDSASDALRLTASGTYDALTHKVVNLGTPTASTDAATKGYVDTNTVGGQVSQAQAYATAAAASAAAAAASAAAVGSFDPTTYYTKTQSDARYYTQSNTYTQSEVNAAIASAVAAANPFITGDFIMSLSAAARTGWVLINDGTLSKAGAGGTTLASADAGNLYAFLWNNFNNTLCPVSTGRGASAAADFAAGKTLTMTKMLGRALVVSGSGSGLSARTLGDIAGAETVAVPLKNHTHAAGSLSVSIAAAIAPDGTTAPKLTYSSTTDSTHTANASGTTGTSGDGASPTMSVVQPQVHINVFIKL